jgi:hypothetical protein
MVHGRFGWQAAAGWGADWGKAGARLRQAHELQSGASSFRGHRYLSPGNAPEGASEEADTTTCFRLLRLALMPAGWHRRLDAFMVTGGARLQSFAAHALALFHVGCCRRQGGFVDVCESEKQQQQNSKSKQQHSRCTDQGTVHQAQPHLLQ